MTCRSTIKRSNENAREMVKYIPVAFAARVRREEGHGLDAQGARSLGYRVVERWRLEAMLDVNWSLVAELLNIATRKALSRAEAA